MINTDSKTSRLEKMFMFKVGEGERPYNASKTSKYKLRKTAWIDLIWKWKLPGNFSWLYYELSVMSSKRWSHSDSKAQLSHMKWLNNSDSLVLLPSLEWNPQHLPHCTPPIPRKNSEWWPEQGCCLNQSLSRFLTQGPYKELIACSQIKGLLLSLAFT